MPEPTIVEKLEADAKAATEKVSALQAELDAARADIEAKSAEISTLSASLANAEKNAEDMSKAHSKRRWRIRPPPKRWRKKPKRVRSWRKARWHETPKR